MSREKFLDTPLGELAAYWLGIRCSGCTLVSFPPLKLMAARQGRTHRLGAVLGRMRCSHCKSPPATVCVVDYPISAGLANGGRVETWRVELVP